MRDCMDLEIRDYPDKLNRSWPEHIYSNLHKTNVLEGHNGCINSISWHPDGQLFATGSDDLNIGLWSYPESRLISLTRTVHEDNIFASIWLDRSTIVSAARDGLVGLFEMRPDSTLTNKRMYGCHQGAAMRIATDPFDPSFFMSCSRDGTVRQYDIREPHRCSPGQCPNALLDSGIEQIGWHSVSISPVRSHFFAVGGDESFPMIYDRRYISSSSAPRENFSNNLVSWIPNPSACKKLPISSVCFSPKTMDLAVSYNSGPIFLANPLNQTEYDKNLHDRDPFYGPHVFTETFRVAEKLSKFIQNESEYDDDLINELTQDLLKDAAKNLSYGRVGSFRRLAAEETLNAALIEFSTGGPWDRCGKLIDESIGMFDNEVPPTAINAIRNLAKQDDRFEYFADLFEDVDVGSEPLSNGPFDIATGPIFAELRSAEFRKINLYNSNRANLLAFGYHNVYSQHSNVETIKDVSFVGTQAEYVATGSDLGYFFIYDAHSDRLVFVGKGDEVVTNVVQSHPTLPVIATSGIEHTVKIWEPSLVKDYSSPDLNNVISEISSRARRPSLSCYVQ